MPGPDPGRYDPASVNDQRIPPRPVRPARHVRSRRCLGAGLALTLTVLVSFAATGAAAVPTQDPGVSTSTAPATVTTGGLDAVSPGGATTTLASDTPAPGSGSRRVADENRKIWLVVGGLVVVALGLSVLTVRYWRHTKPSAPAPDPAPDKATEPVAEGRKDRRARRREEATAGRHSRRSVAGADHAAADDEWEPRGTGEHEQIEVDVDRPLRPRPNSEQRAAAYEAASRSG